MALPVEGTKGQHETSRYLRRQGTDSAGGSTKYASKRTLKLRQSLRDTIQE